MKFKKRIIASLLAIVLLVLSISSCVSKTGVIQPKTQGDEGGLFDEQVTVKVVIGSHPSWPYDENWKAWQYFREETGVNIEVQAIPNSEYMTKVSLLLAAPDTLPDLMFCDSKKFVDTQASLGALIAIDDHIDKLPNYMEFWNSIPENEREESMNQRRSSDGKIYFPPDHGFHTIGNTRAWLYRSDVFEKHNLKTPETMDDMYDVAKKLKELYPDSYPVCVRDGLQNLSIIGSQWAPYFSHQLYYDFITETWHYGAAEDTMKQIVEDLLKLYKDELLPPDYLTINTKSWEELVFNNRGFMMPEYIVRIDFFQTPSREQNPDFTLKVMPPPKANIPTGQHKLSKQNYEMVGYILCNTKDEARINNTLKLFDWMYSEKGRELLSWGKEGETYEIKDGKKQFILEDGESAYSKYGFTSFGLGQCIFAEANEAMYSEDLCEQSKIAIGYGEDYMNPYQWLSLKDEDQAVINDLLNEINSFSNEMLSKFLYGLEPMSKWDSFQTELKNSGVDELIDYYATTYKSVVKE